MGHKLDQKQRKVLELIDRKRDDILALCSEMVKIRSINPYYPGVSTAEELGGETAVTERYAKEYKRIGCKVEMVKGGEKRYNVVGVRKGSGGGRSLIFNGHVDTVPVSSPEQWVAGDPFSGVIREGRLYGRGSCDMKGPVTGQLKAVEAIVEAGITLKGDLILEAVCGEENMDHKAGVTAVTEAGYRADGAVVCEPSAPPHHLAVVPVSGGLLWMGLKIKGKATHIGVREELVRAGGRGAAIGVNAIEKGVYLIHALQRLEEQWGQTRNHPLFKPGHFTIHPGIIHGGPYGVEIPFVVSEYTNIEYAIWYPPQNSPEEIQKEIEEYIQDACRLDPWLRENPPEVVWKLLWPAYETPVDHPLTQAMIHSHEAVAADHPKYGGPAKLQGFVAVADASFLQAKGIPCVIYGPGSILVAHSINEYVDVEELMLFVKAQALMAMNWCGYE